MKFIFAVFALAVLAIAPAHATENRLTVSDIHNFVGQASSAINNPNPGMPRIFFSRAAADNALFANRVTHFHTNYAYADQWHRVWHNDPYYGAYYRYPVNPYYNRTSTNALYKPGFIQMIEDKKARIPGYQVRIDITDTHINPYANAAIVDIDMKEYSLAYTPYSASLTTRVMHTNSKCKIYLNKRGVSDIFLSRMDCNTNTSLPF